MYPISYGIQENSIDNSKHADYYCGDVAVVVVVPRTIDPSVAPATFRVTQIPETILAHWGE